MNYDIQRDTELEREFIGRLIAESSLMHECYGLVELEDLLDSHAKKIYEKMIELYESGSSWDIIVLYSYLNEDLEGLSRITKSIGLHSFRILAKAIKDSSLRRTIFNFMFDQSEKLWDKQPTHSVTESLNFFTKIDSITKKETDWSIMTSITQHKHIMQARMNGETVGIKTGFPDLDYSLGQGMSRKDLIILGARPSVGKTSFSLSVAYNAAKSGSNVLFITLEMDNQEVLDRLIAFQSGLSVTSIIRGKVQQERIEKAYFELSKLSLSLIHLPKASTAEIHAVASKHKIIQGLDLLVVDYLGLISDEDENEVKSLGKISKNLRTTANLLNCVVLAPHQLSRKIETRSEEKKKTPLLSDLRDSGHIEQDADVIMFLNRDTLGEISTRATLRIGKNRTGQTGIHDFKFNPITTRFEL